MSNAKKVYSSKASEYTSGMSNAPEIVRKRFERSLLKKEMYQGTWEKVNINELVEKYTLGITPIRHFRRTQESKSLRSTNRIANFFAKILSIPSTTIATRFSNLRTGR